MAETATAKGGFGFLARKVGPLPLGIWVAGGAALVWYYEKQNKTAAGAGAQLTDPAGNTCSALNPETGFCPGTDQDIAALNAAAGNVAAGQAASGGDAGSSGGTASGGGGTDTSGAAGTGAPSGGPSPTPAPVPAPPVNPKWAYPAPKSLTAYSVAAKGYRIRWTAVRGPGGQVPSTYTVATYSSAGALVDQFTTPSTDTAEYGKGGGGLPKGSYHTNVWANGSPQAPAHATVPVTLKG